MKLPSFSEIVCAAAILAVIAFGFVPAIGQTYNVKNLLGPENLQTVMDQIAADLGGIVSASGTSTVQGTLKTATNGYIIVLTGTANSPTAGALAISGTNLYIGNGTNWLAK